MSTGKPWSGEIYGAKNDPVKSAVLEIGGFPPWWLSYQKEKSKQSTRSRATGLHKLWYPSIRDTSTWSKFGAHGEHGDVFLFSNLGALWFSENLLRYSLHVCLREVKNIFFHSNTLFYGISRDGSKNFNIRTCEHMILGQLRIWARPATYAALQLSKYIFLLCLS